MFIGHVSCSRCNLVKTRACQEPISFRNFVIVAFDEGERTLIGKYSHFYGLYNVVNLAPPENFSGANDVIPMPCACFAVWSDFSRQNCPLLWSVIAAVWRVFIQGRRVLINHRTS